MERQPPQNINDSYSASDDSGLIQKLSEHSYTPIILTAIMLTLLFITAAFIAYRVTPSQNAAKIEVSDDTPIPTASLKMDKDQENQEVLVKIEFTGGLCPDGACYTSINVNRNGKVIINDEVKTTLDELQIDNLKKLISETDFDQIKSNRFSGTCPIAYDGQEVTYTFYLENNDQVIPSCTYDIDDSMPLFIEVNTIIDQAQ